VASALEGLVEKGLVAPDWAAALAPVDDRIAQMGQFLRSELAAGRGYQPAGEHVLRAFQRPLAQVKSWSWARIPTRTLAIPSGCASP